ncbi:MAG: bifunctional phosphopantothenoylcysteine decarboxylase/phosphopantothenate--cysteine ligase CoaBC, partial [Rhodospirillales bacterium]|nr:bifunctional phosphopantothenoylcysteine decarboxylase/phosphopantothenate--cysteine ligase CoaBC [Rhodospirillales bacterium]
ILAKMAHGIADDLATTALLATDKPVMAAPAMNVRMWEHAATGANLRTLEDRGVIQVGPAEGDMACGEWGMGRMAEPADILAAIEGFFRLPGPLAGRRALVTSGPTHEAIDPVRYLANRSSGKQGHAVAEALARLGAETTLVTGPTQLDDPPGLKVVHVVSALEMLSACQAAGAVDVVVCAAAVSDWRTEKEADAKIKKESDPATPPSLQLVENPDILRTLSAKGKHRPKLIVGFAAETEKVTENAQSKRHAKGCDWIVANDVSEAAGTFGGDSNTVHLVTGDKVESWPTMSKREVASRLAQRIAGALGDATQGGAP